MSLQQKRARFELAVVVVAIAAAITIGATVSIEVAWAGFALLGFWGLAPLLFRADHKTGSVTVDERDAAIGRRAALYAFTASYLSVVVTCVGIWAVAYFGLGVEQVSIQWVVAPVWVAFLVACAGHAIAVLVLYERQVAHAD
jgi:hypothetical protein